VPFSYQAAVFDNRFPAVVAEPPAPPPGPDFGPSVGRAEVVMYTEVHDATFGGLEPAELARVIAVWKDRSNELWADPALAFVMAFENRGELVGATLSHPHGQVIAVDHLPPTITARIRALADGRRASGHCVTCSAAERDAAERAVLVNDHFVVAVPFAPRWPYEVHVRARRHDLRRLRDLGAEEQQALAAALRGLVRRYDRLFGFELPYMMTIMEAPPGVEDWHLALEFLPPHRTERLTKVRASVETATGLFLNDTLPEASAARLAGIAAPTEAEAPPFHVVATEGQAIA
jgi:UDPglucose--hexose-1-phosphate uridylyltransferase